MNFLKNTKLMGGVVVVIILILGWWYWSSGSSSAPVATTAPASPASQNLLTLLSSLHSITLDPSIFSDPNFEALSDFGVTIPDEAAGRRNPFAPVGSAQAAPAQTPAQTQTQTPPAGH